MAVNRVEELLRKVSEALNAAAIPYAVIGGNAVAAWVATVDEGAVRATKNVDILLQRKDLDRVTEALRSVGLMPVEVLGVYMFVDREYPNPKTGVHVVIAKEKIRPHYTYAAPDTSRFVEQGSMRIVELQALVEMKLQSYRFIDKAHVQDMISVGLITNELRSALPTDLRERLRAIEESNDPEGH